MLLTSKSTTCCWNKSDFVNILCETFTFNFSTNLINKIIIKYKITINN